MRQHYELKLVYDQEESCLPFSPRLPSESKETLTHEFFTRIYSKFAKIISHKVNILKGSCVQYETVTHNNQYIKSYKEKR